MCDINLMLTVDVHLMLTVDATKLSILSMFDGQLTSTVDIILMSSQYFLMQVENMSVRCLILLIYFCLSIRFLVTEYLIAHQKKNYWKKIGNIQQTS